MVQSIVLADGLLESPDVFAILRDLIITKEHEIRAAYPPGTSPSAHMVLAGIYMRC